MNTQRLFDRDQRAARHLFKAQLRVIRNQRRAEAQRSAAQRMRRFNRWALFWRLVFWIGLTLSLALIATRCSTGAA